MKRILERYPFFLFLLPLFVIIHFEKEFNVVIKHEFIYDRIIILFAVPILGFLFFYIFFRSVLKSSLMTFGFLLVFYYTGDLRNWLTQILPDSIWQRYTLILPVLFSILVMLFFWLKKNKSSLQRHCFYINIAFLLFILSDAVQLFLTHRQYKNKIYPVTEIENSVCHNCTRPDIFYIIFDAYASSKQLQSEFGYSNYQIEEDLKKKGFRIIKDSKSNYNYTAFSLASTFNMSYIKNIDTNHTIQSRLYFQCVKLVHNNVIFSFFQKENYQIFNLSFFDVKSFPGIIQHADVWDMKKLIDQYNLFFKMYRDLHHFPVRVNDLFATKFLWNVPEKRNDIDLIVYNHVLRAAHLESSHPKFVYAHFMRPHPSYHFDSLGRRFRNDTISNREAYIHQIAYSNRMIKNMTDSIMAYTKRPLVIIIQGDHGDKNTQEKQRAFSNFNAIYFSDNNYSLLNDSITNVNTFRIVLNTFFRKDLALLPNKSYFIYQ